MAVKIVFFLALAIQICFADQKSFDCKMRQIALDYARKIQPFRTKMQFQQVADALNGAQEAQNCSVKVDIPDDGGWKPPSFPLPSSTAAMFYVDANKGSDSNSGTESAPFKTIEKALAAARSAGHSSTIILRQGIFYLTETIKFGSHDNGLTIMNYKNEEVWISGAKVITPKWTSWRTSGQDNIYVADLSSEGIKNIPGLRVNGK